MTPVIPMNTVIPMTTFVCERNTLQDAQRG